jgi:hypothetical protein
MCAKLTPLAGIISDCGPVSVSSASPRVQWFCESGQISRLSYANHERMSGIIISSIQPLILTFTTFETEFGWDFVTVKRCAAANCVQTTTLLHQSGYSLPSPLVSDTGIMLIEWYSDDSVIDSGWSASWTSGWTDPWTKVCIPCANGTFSTEGDIRVSG